MEKLIPLGRLRINMDTNSKMVPSRFTRNLAYKIYFVIKIAQELGCKVNPEVNFTFFFSKKHIVSAKR